MSFKAILFKHLKHTIYKSYQPKTENIIQSDNSIKILNSKKTKIRIKSEMSDKLKKKPKEKGNNLQKQDNDSLRKRKLNSSNSNERDNQKNLQDSTIILKLTSLKKKINLSTFSNSI